MKPLQHQTSLDVAGRHYLSLVMRKPVICICENKNAEQLRGNREADQRIFFATRLEQSLYFLNPKFQASSHLLWLYSLVCVGPGRKPRRPVLSQRGSSIACTFCPFLKSIFVLFNVRLLVLFHNTLNYRSRIIVRAALLSFGLTFLIFLRDPIT